MLVAQGYCAAAHANHSTRVTIAQHGSAAAQIACWSSGAQSQFNVRVTRIPACTHGEVLWLHRIHLLAEATRTLAHPPKLAPSPPDKKAR